MPDDKDGKDAKRILGVFSVPSYTSLDLPYGMTAEDRKKRIPSQVMGKQFETKALKHGKTLDVYFDYGLEQKHKWLFAGKNYQDTQPQKYIDTQPPANRAKGFLSSDANKRDEFTNLSRSRQLLQTIERETAISKAGQERLMKENGGLEEPPLPDKFEEDEGSYVYDGPKFLYDIGRDADTQFCKKCSRDKFYNPNNAKKDPGDIPLKRLGPARNYLSSISIGVGANQLSGEGSVFARRPLIRETFFRQTGVFPPPQKP